MANLTNSEGGNQEQSQREQQPLLEQELESEQEPPLEQELERQQEPPLEQELEREQEPLLEQELESEQEPPLGQQPSPEQQTEEVREPGQTERRALDCSLRINGVEFVIVPSAEYARRAESYPNRPAAESRNAKRAADAKRLRDARRRAGLTQSRLAERLGRSQSTVSQAESGSARVGDRYISSVLAACKLEPNWGLPAVTASSEEERSGWALEWSEIAGLDPETLEPVRKGSDRDLELRRKLVWWGNAFAF